MGQISNDAAVKDAQIKPRKEDCAEGTVQSLNYVAVKDAQIEFGKEVFASSMGQRFRPKDAAVKVVQNKLRKEEFAEGMGQRGCYVAVKDVRM